MFVETTKGDLIALRLIDKVYPPGGRFDHYRIVFGEGQAEVYRSDFEHAMVRASMVIPALPGTYLIGWGIDPDKDNEEWISKEPVIAWRINEYGTAHPVTCESMADDVTILFPDGIVIDVETMQFDSIEAYKKHRRLEREKELAA